MWKKLVGLALAMAAVTIMLTQKPSTPQVPDPHQIEVTTFPGNLDGGMPYTPLTFLNSTTSIGLSPGTDAASIRLLWREADRAPRLIRTVPDSAATMVVGLTVTTEALVWAELSTVDSRVAAIWRADRDGSNARLLTKETGYLVTFQSESDLVVHNGRVWWAARARSAWTDTEIRSVPLGGGAVSIVRFAGQFVLTAYPWIVSGGVEQAGPAELRSLADGTVRPVIADQFQLVDCSPTWCRVRTLNHVKTTIKYEIMRPDGTARRQVGGGLQAATYDVALLDRFEIFLDQGAVSVYDIARNRMTLVTQGIGTVFARGGFLWWSSGTNTALTWHLVDLSTLGT